MVYIDALTLKNMFFAGTKKLEDRQYYINDLNVFPVPDGDTGTNMTLTLMSAAKELALLEDDAKLETVGRKIANGTLKGARGNSGVIMSQLCRGFTNELSGNDKADIELISKALNTASEYAYKAVMKPQEGTILTVAKAVSERAEELKNGDVDSLEDFFKDLIETADDVLQKTPDMLPVLKEAGVVDSGGQGLLEFYKGAYDAFCGKEVSLDVFSAEEETASVYVNTRDIETSDIRFSYCTEYIVNLLKDFTAEDESAVKKYLSSIGDSLVCVWMDDVLKIHVHTNDPGLAIQKGLEYGTLSNIKIDNMKEEHNERVIKDVERQLSQGLDDKKVENTGTRKEYAFVAVCAGDGIAKVFKNMSVNDIIEGGQTMNPSTEDFLRVIKTINADNIFLLPNNGNVIMAARQAGELCKDKNVFVIPTKTITQGIAAVINYVPAMSIEENAAHMEEAVKEVKTAEITYAVRDSSIDGININKDDFMAIGDHGLITTGGELDEVAFDSIRRLFDDDSEIITIYYGKDVSKEDAEAFAAKAEAEFEEADVEVVFGGQPVYPYIISVE